VRNHPLKFFGILKDYSVYQNTSGFENIIVFSRFYTRSNIIKLFRGFFKCKLLYLLFNILTKNSIGRYLITIALQGDRIIFI